MTQRSGSLGAARRLGRHALVSGVLLLVLGVLAPSVSAAHLVDNVDPSEVYTVDEEDIANEGGNPTCEEALGDREPADVTPLPDDLGGYTTDGAKNDGTLHVDTEFVDGVEDARTLSFEVVAPTEPDVKIYAVVIKQATTPTVYYYEDGVGVGQGDSGLDGVNDGISNFRFCYGVEAPVLTDLFLAKANAGDTDGTPTSFDFVVNCGESDVPVTREAGAGPGAAVVTGLEAGETCTISETDTQGAVLTFGSDPAGALTSDPSANPATIVIPEPGDVQSASVTVTATNTFTDQTVGDILLEKELLDADPDDDVDETTEFQFTVSCGDTAEDEGLVAAVQMYDVAAEDGAVVVGDDLEPGTECTIQETDAHGADGVSYAAEPASAIVPDGVDSITVAVPEDGADVTVTVTNTFEQVAGTTVEPAEPTEPTVLGTNVQPQLAATGFNETLLAVGAMALALGVLLLLGESRLTGDALASRARHPRRE